MYEKEVKKAKNTSWVSAVYTDISRNVQRTLEKNIDNKVSF